MIKFKIRYLKNVDGRYYWEPSAAMRAAGFMSRRLHGSMEEICARAESLNAEWDGALEAREVGVRTLMHKALGNGENVTHLFSVGKRSGVVRPNRDSRAKIYFVQLGDDGPVKIGFARNVFARLRDMQVSNPYQLKLLVSVHWGHQWEGVLHERFAAHWIRGEWFTPSVEIMTLARELAKFGGETLPPCLSDLKYPILGSNRT